MFRADAVTFSLVVIPVVRITSAASVSIFLFSSLCNIII